MTGMTKRSPSGIPMDLDGHSGIEQASKRPAVCSALSNQPGVVIRGEEMPSLPPSMIGCSIRIGFQPQCHIHGKFGGCRTQFPQSNTSFRVSDAILTVKP
jgi:hypothetical protein